MKRTYVNETIQLYIRKSTSKTERTGGDDVKLFETKGKRNNRPLNENGLNLENQPLDEDEPKAGNDSCCSSRREH